jgi:NPCBM-associated, NEW3 domain of alpha-galactosidase
LYRHARRLVAAIAPTALALAAVSVAQANFVAVATDPAGDAGDPSPARDITGAGLSYDPRSGELVGAIQLRGEPSGETNAFVSLLAGTRTASGCDAQPTAGFGSYSDEFGASWLRLDDPAGNGPRGEADKRGYLADVQRFEISDPQLADLSPDCAIALLTEPGNPANVYDALGPLDLVGQPALSLSIRGVPRTFGAGRPRRIKLVVTNEGDAPTGRVRLKFGRARGLTVKTRSRTLKTIAPQQRTTVTATVTLSRRASTATDLKVTATAGRLIARQETTISVRKPTKTGGGGGSSRSCVRYQADLSGETGGSLILVPC